MSKEKKRPQGRPQSEIKKGNPTAMTVAENVRRIRKKKGLTVAEAAASAGISVEQWYRIERGAVTWRTPYDTLRAIATVLGFAEHYPLYKLENEKVNAPRRRAKAKA